MQLDASGNVAFNSASSGMSEHNAVATVNAYTIIPYMVSSRFARLSIDNDRDRDRIASVYPAC